MPESRKTGEIFQDESIKDVVVESSQKAVSVLRNASSILPLRIKSSERVLIVTPQDVNDVGVHNIDLFSYVKQRHQNAEFKLMGLEPTRAQEDRILSGISSYAHVIVGLYDHPYISESRSINRQIEILMKILKKNKNVTVVLMKDPLVYQRLPTEAATVIATYGIKPEQLIAAADVIFGFLEPTGKSPVGIGSKLSNQAMRSLTPTTMPGGIDFSFDKALTVRSNGQAIKFQVDPAMSANSYWRDLATSGGLEEFRNAPGFTPVVIRLQEGVDLRQFLGI